MRGSIVEGARTGEEDPHIRDEIYIGKRPSNRQIPQLPWEAFGHRGQVCEPEVATRAGRAEKAACGTLAVVIGRIFGGGRYRCELPHFCSWPEPDLNESEGDDKDDVLDEANQPGLEAMRVGVIFSLRFIPAAMRKDMSEQELLLCTFCRARLRVHRQRPAVSGVNRGGSGSAGLTPSQVRQLHHPQSQTSSSDSSSSPCPTHYPP